MDEESLEDVLGRLEIEPHTATTSEVKLLRDELKRLREYLAGFPAYFEDAGHDAAEALIGLIESGYKWRKD